MFSAPVILAAALAMLSPAQTPPASAPSAPTAAQDQSTRPARASEICERRATTGRRLKRRVCRTREQHAAMVETNRREAEEVVAQSYQINSEIRGIIDPN